MADEKTNILLGFSKETLRKLDKLCEVNDRSRPKLTGILIDRAHAELEADDTARVNPTTAAETD